MSAPQTKPNKTKQIETARRRLSSELCELVQDFGLLSFLPLAIEASPVGRRVLAVVCAVSGVAGGSTLEAYAVVMQTRSLV
jgi:hypothetical protein